MRILYLGCVIPILTWGSEIWYQGHNDGPRLHLLRRVERLGLLRVLGCWKPSPTAQLHSLAGCTPIELLITQRRGEYACRRRWGSILPLPNLHPRRHITPEHSHKSLLVRLQCDLPLDVEGFTRDQWPPPWSTHRTHPRISWDIDPAPNGPDRVHRVAYLDSLHTPDRWMVYCDGSFVWRPQEPDTSRGGAASIVIHQEHILAFERLGLGSRTHSRDTELWALNTALKMLNKQPPADYVAEVVIVSDAALALKQLHSTKPEPGHSLILSWHEAVSTLLNANPHITLRVMWGPSKSSLSLLTADQLAKCSRTSGSSPLVSLRTQRMQMRNTSLQRWRQYVLTSDNQARPTRLSMPYLVPNRDPPHWLALPRALQARLCQLLTGRAPIQTFLHTVDPDTYGSQCPLGDGQGTLDHYLQTCSLTHAWRESVQHKLELEVFPTSDVLLHHYMEYVLHLLDHTALGTRAFQVEAGHHLRDPERKFWHPSHTPLTRPFSAWDMKPYMSPGTNLPFPREGPESEIATLLPAIVPDQDFGKECKLPPMTRAQRARPLWTDNPLAEADLATPTPSPPRRRARPRPRPPLVRPIVHPPGRPPETDSDSSSDQRPSSPDWLTYSDM